jgi:hypothetical protein
VSTDVFLWFVVELVIGVVLLFHPTVPGQTFVAATTVVTSALLLTRGLGTRT